MVAGVAAVAAGRGCQDLPERRAGRGLRLVGRRGVRGVRGASVALALVGETHCLRTFSKSPGLDRL